MAEHLWWHEEADLYRVRSGVRLRRHRERLGLSCRQLAEATGLNNHSIITRYEGGVEPPPERRVLLADALGVTPDDIWHFHDDHERSPR
jgi:transcriptional regulator with XRE-family HTH domain